MHAGIATHYCNSANISHIEESLLASRNANDVDNVFNELCPKPKSEFTLSKHLDQINKAFNASSMEEILSNLEKDNSEWAKKTIQVSSFNIYSIFLAISVSITMPFDIIFNRLFVHFVQPV